MRAKMRTLSSTVDASTVIHSAEIYAKNGAVIQIDAMPAPIAAWCTTNDAVLSALCL